MKMKILIIMMMLLCIGIANAAVLDTTVTLDGLGTLTNGSWQTSTSIAYNIVVTGNLSYYECDLWTNENGTNGVGEWHRASTGVSVANNTNTTLTTRIVKETSGTGIGVGYSWDVACNGTTSVEQGWGANGAADSVANMTYGVDATAPVIVLDNPTNKEWFTDDSAVRIGLTVTDDNAAQCVLGTNLDVENDNTTTFNTAFETYSYTNATAFNFTNINSSQSFADDATGLYLYTYSCNDSAGNSAELGSNYTFFIDSTAPAAFDFNTTLWRTDDRLLTNESCTGCGSYTYLSMATDYTPQVGWTGSVETNFSRYEVLFFPLTYGNTTGMINTTAGALDNSTLQVNTSTLAADQKYAIRIIAYDLAGNSINSTTSAFEYGTDSTNRALKSGWNVVGNVGTNMTLSEVMNWTGASTTSIWNASHEFVSHVSGGSNGAEVVPAGQPVLLYLSADTNVENWIWNTAEDGGIDGPILNGAVNMTNQTADDWNLIMCKNLTSWNFQQLDDLVNPTKASEKLNITYFSMYDNTASEGAKYVPFVGNWSINNDTTIEFGETMWMYIGQDVHRDDGSLLLNWSVA